MTPPRKNNLRSAAYISKCVHGWWQRRLSSDLEMKKAQVLDISKSHTGDEAFPLSLSECLCRMLRCHRQLAPSHTEKLVGRTRGLALPITFVIAVTGCRELIINEVGCGCQRTSVLSHSNVQVWLLYAAMPKATPPPTPRQTTTTYPHLRSPSISTLCASQWRANTASEKQGRKSNFHPF